jgi:bifunctional DNA-binding transcriptional regulator/antitoxin component of YhaV-PrlF toxin-antitoxin module
MTTIVKRKTLIVIPPAIRRQAGIKTGHHVEFKLNSSNSGSGGGI